jgi:hypothetical protein
MIGAADMPKQTRVGIKTILTLSKRFKVVKILLDIRKAVGHVMIGVRHVIGA